MNFFSDCYQRTKLGLSGLGAVGSTTTIIVGIVVTHGTIAVPIVIAGIAWLCISGISLIETLSTYSILKKDIDRLRKNIKEFEEENFELKSNLARMRGDIQKLGETRREFVIENKKLVTSVEKSKEQLSKLSELNQNYNKMVQKSKNMLEDEKLSVQKLENEIKGFINLKDSFYKENFKLKEMNKNSEKLIIKLEKLKDNYISENKELKSLNEKNGKQLVFLETQVSKLKELYSNTKKLMKNIVNASNTFNDISIDIDRSAENLGNTNEDYNKTLEQMKNLLERLKDKTFNNFDKNNDGVISAEEFENEVEHF